jgi:hypothetical protein
VVKFVIASFMLAIIPAVLGTAWRLVCGIVDQIGQSFPPAGEVLEPDGPQSPVNNAQPQRCLQAVAGIEHVRLPRSSASNRQRSTYVSRSDLFRSWS